MSFADLQPFILSEVEFTGREIGSGAYGSVEEISVSGKLCAAKTLHSMVERNIVRATSQFVEECRLMSTLPPHPNIVQFLGVVERPGHLVPCLVMEKMTASLHDTLEAGEFKTLSLKCSVLEDIACGLHFLHDCSPPILHRDLTAMNVLLNSEKQAKISDLGMARCCSGSAMMTKGPGNILYMPPEAIYPNTESEFQKENNRECKYDKSIDIFSFGVLAIFTLSETFPCDLDAPIFHQKDKLTPRTEIERRTRYIEIVLKKLNNDAEHPFMLMIHQCLDHSDYRPDASKVLATTRKVINDMDAALTRELKQADKETDVKMLEITGQEEHSQYQTNCLPPLTSAFTSRYLGSSTKINAIPLIILSCDKWNPETNQLDIGRRKPNDYSMKLVDDAVHLIKNIEKPIAVISMSGLQFSGKSYLLSHFLPTTGAFLQGSNRKQQTTRGIWMATSVLEHSEFVVVLLDTEGIDPITGSGINFLTLSCLLSSFVIYNTRKTTKRAVTEDVQNLKPFLQVCDSLDNSSCKVDQLKPFMPHVMWLLRDVRLQNDTVLTELYESSETLATKLEHFFPSYECACLPQPSFNMKLDLEKQQEKIRQVFNQAVHCLVERLIHQVPKKRAINGAIIPNGRIFCRHISCCIEAVKKKSSILHHLQLSWHSVVNDEIQEYSQRLVSEYEEEMKTLSMPMSVSNLKKIHMRWLKMVKHKLEREIYNVEPNSDEKYIHSMLNQLEKQIVQWDNTKPQHRLRGGSFHQISQNNYTASMSVCEKLLKNLIKASEIENKVEIALHNSEYHDIEAEIVVLKEEYHKIAKGPAIDDVLSSELSKLNKYRDALRLMPGKPRSIRVTKKGSEMVKICWEAPEENPHSVDEYVILQGAKGCELREVARTTLLSAEISGSTKYQHQVRASTSLQTTFSLIEDR